MLENIYTLIITFVFFLITTFSGNQLRQNSNFVSKAALILPTLSPTATTPQSPTPTKVTKKSPIKKIITLPTQRSQQTTDDAKPWGVSEKIGEHTYTIKLGNDDRMGTPIEIFEALNNYRRNHSSGSLSWDNTLADYANGRAQLFKSIKNTDSHAGLNDFLEHQDGFNKLRFNRVGENSYFGGPQHGVHIIEWVFSSSPEHNANQLDGSWSHVGIGVTDESVNIIFGGSKM